MADVMKVYRFTVLDGNTPVKDVRVNIVTSMCRKDLVNVIKMKTKACNNCDIALTFSVLPLVKAVKIWPCIVDVLKKVTLLHAKR